MVMDPSGADMTSAVHQRIMCCPQLCGSQIAAATAPKGLVVCGKRKTQSVNTMADAITSTDQVYFCPCGQHRIEIVSQSIRERGRIRGPSDIDASKPSDH